MSNGLVLARKVGERIMIGDDIVLTVLKIMGQSEITLGVEAPQEVPIERIERSEHGSSRQIPGCS